MKNCIFFLSVLMILASQNLFSQAIIIDHHSAKLTPISESAINQAKQNLHIAYGHTSHGSQLITGMSALVGQTNLVGYKGDIYEWNEGGTGGALDIDDYFGSGDLGHNGDTTWAPPTRTYLSDNTDVNVVMYSWCGGVSDNTFEGIQTYLDKMSELEQDYPNVTFVYMTGHSDIWADSALKANNQQIRDYCLANNKILYDFYDIERYDPDGIFYEFTDDNCGYYDGAGGTLLGNWATEWQNSHTEGVDWYNCSPAHTQALNGNLKAYASWWLFCRIAGWEGTDVKEINNTADIKMYPNPVKDKLILKSTDRINTVQIIDISGKVLFIKNMFNSKFEINVSELKNGTYFMKIQTNNKTEILRFVKV